MTNSNNKSIDISVVLVSYNTRDLTDQCLDSLKKEKLNMQIIVSDNGSADGSVEMIKQKKSHIGYVVELIENNRNLGFAKGNNKARKHVKSDYVLFLNTDTVVYKDSIKKPLQYIKEHPEVGAITSRVLLPDGPDDPDTIRAFPTPVMAAKHFLGLKSEFRYPDLDRSKIQDVDVIQGAYFLTKKEILDQVGWFDEDYFLDGEDIDLSYRIKQAGYKLIYLPSAKITHIKKASKNTDRKKSLKSVTRGVEAMELFYKKHLIKKNNFIYNFFIITSIKLLKLARIAKYYLNN